MLKVFRLLFFLNGCVFNTIQGIKCEEVSSAFASSTFVMQQITGSEFVEKKDSNNLF